MQQENVIVKTKHDVSDNSSGVRRIYCENNLGNLQCLKPVNNIKAERIFEFVNANRSRRHCQSIPLRTKEECCMTDMNVKKQMGIVNEVPNTARNYKDRIFRMIFKEKRALLALYNAMNHTEYTDEDALTVTTLENAIYMEMKNDVSFVLYDQLLLYEHQSTKNPSIPLRNLFYVSDIYSALTRDKFLYGSVPVKIPEPRFVVFYNGEEATEEREILRLSALYEKQSEHVTLELETEVLNINIGYNRELMEHCRELHDYAKFVSCVREKRKQKLHLSDAVNEAVDECIQNGILTEFLKKNRVVSNNL